MNEHEVAIKEIQESFNKIDKHFKGRLGNNNREYPFTRFDIENVRLAVDYMTEKETPSKPIKTYMRRNTDNELVEVEVCPTCNLAIVYEKQLRCDKCGKKIDWSG